jgi:hypothetical protein
LQDFSDIRIPALAASAVPMTDSKIPEAKDNQ